ncbi:MAG: serine/threonine protein kinase [Planctomycetaceae bacterium]|nr:serine/threonine protein kinase [Planctomycetaceae bacterium]
MSQSDISGVSLDETARVWSVLEGHIERFLHAWESGAAPPEIGPHLPAGHGAVRRMTLIELIKVDLEARRQPGRELRPLEHYLADFPELADEIPPDLVYEEYHIRKQAGDAVDVPAYLARFPQIARELERLFGIGGAGEVSTSMFGSRAAVVGSELNPGERIDDFDLLARLGQGAFASVFLARQISMQRLVALKVSADRGAEPQTLAQLDHEQIVRVYDQRLLPDRGLRLMYMQYLAGGTLQQVVEEVRRTTDGARTGGLLFAAIDRALAERGESRPAEAPLRERFANAPWAEVVCWIGARLARGLDYAHRQGVLHRDIKPANVLLAADGAPKLADFNISFSSKLDGATPAAYFGGSLAYMSPEQLEACNVEHERQPDSLDGRSDLYSLGILLWELLSGARPFRDEQVQAAWSATLGQMTARRRAGLDRAHLALVARHWPPGLDQILERCLDPDTDRRYPNGGELARHLELCLQPQARRLLSPSRDDWRRLGRRHPIAGVVVAAIPPNLAAAVFNYFYNDLEIVSHLPAGAEEIFWRTQLAINSIAFPLGIGLALALSWPVAAAVRRAGLIATLPADALRRLRQRCLRLGHYAAAISLSLWLLAAPAYPIAINLGVAEVPAAAYLHFVASLALCGMIASAYPFFGVSCLAVCCLYPALARLETMTRDDRDSLQRLSRSSWIYLLVAASVPMLSVAVLVLIRSQAQFALGLLAAGGVAGLASAFWLFRTLQADLAALTLVAAPPDELHDSVSRSMRGF